MKKYSNASILFLILAALNHLESAKVPMDKQAVKGTDKNESGEWVYESFSVSVDSEGDGENGFKIDKAAREAELLKKYELYKAAEEEKKMAAKMAELQAMEAEIEAKKSQMEARMADLQAELAKKLGKKAAGATEIEVIRVLDDKQVKAVAAKVEQRTVENAKKQEDQSDSETEIEILRVPETQISVKKQEDAKPQGEPKRILPNPKRLIITPPQYRNSVRFSQNLVQVKENSMDKDYSGSSDSEKTASDISGTDSNSESDSESDSENDSESEKPFREEEILKAVMASKEIKKEAADQHQPKQEQKEESKSLSMGRMSTRVPAASPIVIGNKEGTVAGRRSILKKMNQGSPLRRSVTLKSLTEERKSQVANLNGDDFDGDDDDDDDYFKPKTGRQTQKHPRKLYNPEHQRQNFYEDQMMARATANTRQSTYPQFHPNQYDYDYEDEQEQEQTGHDLSGIRLGFCDAAVLGAIANIKMISMKYPRQANSVERKKTAQYITSLIENFPCEKEKEVMKRAVVAHPPIYTERKSFNRWASQYTRTVLRDAKCPVGVSTNSLLIPLKKKK